MFVVAREAWTQAVAARDTLRYSSAGRPGSPPPPARAFDVCPGLYSLPIAAIATNARMALSSLGCSNGNAWLFFFRNIVHVHSKIDFPICSIVKQYRQCWNPEPETSIPRNP